ncbi:hypothetical protein [Helicobacter pullorum]|uniref:Uncharacterized protein n=1 Tax=Helicobacter pullorum TaxID=35818 RepID=A0A0N1E2D1_9HELI|nr:hypothetical protein [Helicobacter pullorum]KPH49720.1 hypothetical protein HPU229254_00280 [Helicobacter pullorum]KPH52307.1 hypothetical protein HPU229334_02095 [Helicobacter pullorum]
MNNNMAKDTEFKEINNTKNTESIKLDSNGDEIIWELERKINFFIILAYIFYFCIIVGFTYILTIYIIPNIDNWKSIFVFLFLIFGIIFLGREMYFSLNLKKMYILGNNLFIEKYLGQGLKLPLDEIIIFEKRTYNKNFVAASIQEIASISHHTTIYYFFMESGSTNTNEIKPALKPYILDYLLKCDKKSYDEFKIYYHRHNIQHQYNIDYDTIDNLRKEKENGK